MGIMPGSETTPVEKTPSISGIGVIAAIVLAGALVYRIRKK
jgi:hypothetical protein